MTPAEWLAAIILAWMSVAAVWQVVDEPVTRTWHSGFYKLVAFCVEIPMIVLSFVVLSIAWYWALIGFLVLMLLALAGELANR